VLNHSLDATLHVANRGCHTVARFWGFAGGTCVVGTESNAMCPTVVHNGAISGLQCLIMNGGGHEGSMGCGVEAHVKVAGGWHHNSIGTLETSLCTGESFNASIIFFLEVGLEVGHGLLCGLFVFPLVDHGVEHTGFDKYGEHEVHCGGICDGLPTGHCKDLTVANALHRSSTNSLGIHRALRHSQFASRSIGLIGP